MVVLRVLPAVLAVAGCGPQLKNAPARGISTDLGFAVGDGRGAHGYAQAELYGAHAMGHVRGWYDPAEDPLTDNTIVPVPRPALWSLTALAGTHNFRITHGQSDTTELRDCHDTVNDRGQAVHRCTETPTKHDRGGVRGAAVLGGVQLEGRGDAPMRTTAQMLVRMPFPVRAYGRPQVPRAVIDAGVTGVVAGRAADDNYYGHAAFMPGGIVRVHFVYYIAGIGLEAGVTGLQHRERDGSLSTETFARVLLTLGGDAHL